MFKRQRTRYTSWSKTRRLNRTGCEFQSILFKAAIIQFWASWHVQLCSLLGYQTCSRRACIPEWKAFIEEFTNIRSIWRKQSRKRIIGPVPHPSSHCVKLSHPYVFFHERNGTLDELSHILLTDAMRFLILSGTKRMPPQVHSAKWVHTTLLLQLNWLRVVLRC